MFPQRREPELADVLQKHAEEREKEAKGGGGGGGSNKSSRTFGDILIDNGGKVALAALGVAIALFYTYYQGNQDRTRIEEEVLHSAHLEPYEIQELRYLNQIDESCYKRIVDKCMAHFGSGATDTVADTDTNGNNGKYPAVSYRDFIKFMRTDQDLHKIKWSSTHILDRLVIGLVIAKLERDGDGTAAKDGFSLPVNSSELTLIEKTDATTTRGGGSGSMVQQGQQEQVQQEIRQHLQLRAPPHWMDVPLPLDQLLVACNLCMVDYAYDRLEGLFHLALSTQPQQASQQQQFQQESYQEAQKGVQQEGEESHPGETAHTRRPCIDRDTLIRLIQHLVDTDQIPPERQVIPTGVKYPIRRHRRKTPQEMVSAFEKKDEKTQKDLSSVDRDTFVEVLLSNQVCIWAECYRNSGRR